MTIEERARALHAGWQNRTLWTEEMISDIEKALKAAVEEEREAIAKMLNEEIAGLYGAGVDAKATGNLERAEKCFVAVAKLRAMEGRIRARSSNDG